MQSSHSHAEPTATTATTATAAQQQTLSEQQKRKNSQESSNSPAVDTFDTPLQQQQQRQLSIDENANSSNNYRNDIDNNENDGADINGDVDDDEEDYSLSVTAIMQRRASVRGYRGKRGSRSSRRASSPMELALENAERRRSSIYTTSSAEEGTNQESTQEQIFENIRLHKEVLQSVKLQPWPIRKKLKLVRQAKTYIARHEGALQERFAMSRSTKDLWVRFKILMAARWRHWKRETASFLTVLIPWELRIKEIESHFGSGVASYFTFLRWLLWVNLMIAIPLVAFVIGPEYFATKNDEIDPRKRMTDQEFKVAGNLFTIWEFEGFLKYSPLFYGYYSAISGASSLGYKLPLAYFLTALVVYIYSFVATLRKMAENSRNSKLSSKDDECTFSWKLFTGWDFMIGHAETAHNRIASVVVGFKEALLEEAEKKKDNRNWRIIIQRILVNIFITVLLGASGYTVVALVNDAEVLAQKYDNWLSRNAVNVTMTLISFFLPMIFEAVGLFENWHPRQQLRLQLARIMILNLLNLYSLMFSFIYKINSKEKPLQELKTQNGTLTLQMAELYRKIANLSLITTPMPSTTTSLDDTSSSSFSTDDWLSSSTTDTFISTTMATAYTTVGNLVRCYNVTKKCSKPIHVSGSTIATATVLLMNLTKPLLPSFSTEPSSFASLQTDGLPSPASMVWSTVPPFTLPAGSTEESSTFSSTFDTTIFTESSSSGSSTPFTITTTEETTTPLTTSSTTTPSPGNDSFFYYEDYFDGLSLEAVDGAEQQKLAANKSKPQRRLRRLPRQLTLTTEQTLPPSWTSKYSRRRSSTANSLEDNNEISNTTTPKNITTPKATITTPKTTLSTPAIRNVTTSEATTTTPKTTISTPAIRNVTTSEATITTPTTTAATPTAKNITTAKTTITTSETTIATPETTVKTTTTEDTTTTTSTSEAPTTTIDPIFDWNNVDGVNKLAKFFQRSTTMSTPTTTTTENDETTLFFINEKDIEDVGVTIYKNSSELVEYVTCVVNVCEVVTGDPNDEMPDATTKMTTIEMTPMKQHLANLSQIREQLSKIEKNLTTLCWETSLGQELSKIIVFDGIMGIVAPLCVDFLRGLFVRYMNPHWCWDMEKKFPQYGDFKIAENILTLINNQGQVWMGIFFSPGLVIINVVKLMIMMYFRSWIVLTCNVPHEVVFKASKSNNFYLSLLLTMLFLCVLPVGYAIVWLRPSWHCGPFSKYNRISDFITTTIRDSLPQELQEPLNYLTSSSTVIPLLVLLILIIYYLVSLTGALREANQDLRTQLQKEREEERKKFFKKPDEKPCEGGSITNRWRKVLDSSSPVTPTTQPPDFDNDEYKNQARKELISRIMKKALRKGSGTSDDDSMARRDDDDTDNEHNDSLPLDEDGKRPPLSRLQQIRRTRKPSLVDLVQIAKRSPTTPTGPGKDAPPTKSRFRVERLERKNDEKNGKSSDSPLTPITPVTPENENDPDTNSRIVNERRQSLLRRKREDDEEKRRNEQKEQKTQKEQEKQKGQKEQKEHKEKDKEKQKEQKESKEPKEPKEQKEPKESSKPKELTVKNGTKTEKPPPTNSTNSYFEVINEKKPTANAEPPPPPPDESNGIFRFKKPKKKHQATNNNNTTNTGIHNLHAAEPEVFKFDEKTVEKSHAKLGKPVGIPTVPKARAETPNSATAVSSSSASPSPSPSPTLTATLQRHANPEKLINLSRQGRKKIGNFFALMRDTVKKGDDDSSSPEPPSPVTPPRSATAITMPPTPEGEATDVVMPPLQPPPPYSATYQRPDCPAPPLPPELQAIGSVEPIATTAATTIPMADRPTPTITISTTGSEEHLPNIHRQPQPSTTPTTGTTTPTTGTTTPITGTITPITGAVGVLAPIVNLAKINIENERN